MQGVSTQAMPGVRPEGSSAGAGGAAPACRSEAPRFTEYVRSVYDPEDHLICFVSSSVRLGWSPSR